MPIGRQLALDGDGRSAHSCAMSRPRDQFEITTDLLLRAYSIGLFPMAESATDDNLFWVDPEARGIFPLDGLIIPKSLVKTVRSDRFEIKIDCDFDAVIDGCAASYDGREKTWINARIRRLYGELFDIGCVHTVECWAGGALAGGLYGVRIGAAFFGESMFHRQTDASKVALVHLAARLAKGGFLLLDTQFVTPHLASLGAVEVPRKAYRRRLADAISHSGDFWSWPKYERVLGREALAVLQREAPEKRVLPHWPPEIEPSK
jgi:leucyl/phenylalanyl-tRNA--protein transferase